MTREYGQYCGLSHALDLIGGRWTLLIIRELLTGPKRFTDLEQGLPGIPSNILSARMRELEEEGLVERQLQPRPSSGVVYALTEYGWELEDPLLRLGLWGAKSLGPPRPEHFFSPSALALGLRAMFHPEAAGPRPLTFDIQVDGQRMRGSIEKGELTVPDSSQNEPDLTISAEPAVMSELFHRPAALDAAIAEGRFPFTGSRENARRFFEIFHVPAGSDAVRKSA